MSTPARASETEVRASSSRVASLTISNARSAAPGRCRFDRLHFVLRSHSDNSPRRPATSALALAHHAAVSVRHVFAQANIAHDDEVRNFALDGAGRLLHDSVVRPGAGSNLIFGLGQAEEYDGGNTQRAGLPCLLHGLIHRQIEHPRHGAALPCAHPSPGQTNKG